MASGRWSYKAATLTSSSLSITGRCVGYRVFASGADASFNVNGGDTITVRSGSGFISNPNYELVNPTINWVSGTLDVYMEAVN